MAELLDDPDKIALSVIVPLARAREAELEGLRAWTRETIPEGSVELVVVSAEELDDDAEVRRVMRDGDRLLVVPELSETGLWDAGARAARGEVLVLTECHSIAQTGCLQAVVEALRAGLDVACFESRAPELSSAAWLEDAVFQNLFERHVDTGDPRALSLRGIALSRELYLTSGGLRAADHECFAERVLAARLARVGARIGRAPGAVVEHIPNTRFRALRRDNLDFHRDAVGACLAASVSEVDPDTQLEMTPEWDTRARFDPTLNRAALPGLVRLSLGSGRAAYAARRALPGAIARATSPRFSAWSAGLRSHLAIVALHVLWRLGRRPNPLSAWTALSRATLIRILSERSGSGVWAGPLQMRGAGEEITAERLGIHAAGMHVTERLDGTAFRWTEPVVVLDLALPAGVTAIRLELLRKRKLRAGDVGAAWGSRRMPPDAVRLDESTLTVAVPPGARGPLTLCVRRLRSRHDRRRLGLPVVTIAAI